MGCNISTCGRASYLKKTPYFACGAGYVLFLLLFFGRPLMLQLLYYLLHIYYHYIASSREGKGVIIGTKIGNRPFRNYNLLHMRSSSIQDIIILDSTYIFGNGLSENCPYFLTSHPGFLTKCGPWRIGPPPRRSSVEKKFVQLTNKSESWSKVKLGARGIGKGRQNPL